MPDWPAIRFSIAPCVSRTLNATAAIFAWTIPS